ncbi:MAG: hypothetical protein IKL80_02315 [Clostridia bacterium]|nr:hypothetical protein [Clostridia bacterium]
MYTSVARGEPASVAVARKTYLSFARIFLTHFGLTTLLCTSRDSSIDETGKTILIKVITNMRNNPIIFLGVKTNNSFIFSDIQYIIKPFESAGFPKKAQNPPCIPYYSNARYF